MMRIHILMLASLFSAIAIPSATLFVGASDQVNQDIVMEDTAISIDFVVAAMKNQLAAAPNSIEVIYTYGRKDADVEPDRYRYIRSRDALRLETSFPDGKQVYESVNRQSHEYRYLYCPSDSAAKVGTVNLQPTDTFPVQIQFDPLCRILDRGPVYDDIARGSVSQSQDDIEGHPCWRIEVAAIGSSSRIQKYVIWVDQAIGFNPRRLQIEYKSSYSLAPRIIDYTGYCQAWPDVWFPAEIGKRWTDPVTKQPYENIAKCIKVAACRESTNEQLTVQFPSGTQVTDQIRSAEYIVP